MSLKSEHTDKVNFWAVSNCVATLCVYIFCSLINNFYPFFIYISLLLVLLVFFTSRYHLLSIFNFNIIFNIVLNRFYLYKYGLPYYMGGSDDLRSFEIPAEQLINGFGRAMDSFDVIVSVILTNPTYSNIGYIFVVAFFMKLGQLIDSYYTIVPIFFNSFVLVIISLVSKDISIKYFRFTKKRANLIMVLTATFPLIVFMNSHVFRDTLFNLFLILSIYITLIPVRIKWLWILFVLFGISFLRIEYLPIILFNILILPKYLLFLKINTQNHKPFILHLILYFVSICLFSLAMKFGTIDYIFNRIQYYDEIRSELSGRFSNYIFKLPIYLRVPAKFLFLIVNPTPSYGSIEQSYIGTGTLIQLVFTPLTFIGVFLGLKNKNYISYVFIILFLMIGFVSVDSRHKTFLIILGIPLTFYGIDYIKTKIKFSIY